MSNEKKGHWSFVVKMGGFRVLPSDVGDSFHKTDNFFWIPSLTNRKGKQVCIYELLYISLLFLKRLLLPPSSPKVERCSRDLSSLCCWHALRWEAFLEPGWKKNIQPLRSRVQVGQISGKRRWNTNCWMTCPTWNISSKQIEDMIAFTQKIFSGGLNCSFVIRNFPHLENTGFRTIHLDGFWGIKLPRRFFFRFSEADEGVMVSNNTRCDEVFRGRGVGVHHFRTESYYGKIGPLKID